MPGGGVLRDQTGAGIEAEGGGSGEIRLGIGLAAGDVAGSNHGGRGGESDGVEAAGGGVENRANRRERRRGSLPLRTGLSKTPAGN
jgi:hypothetical protein